MGYGRSLLIILLVLTLVFSLIPSTPVAASDRIENLKSKYHPAFYDKIMKLKDNDVVVAVVRLKPLPPEIARSVYGNHKLAVDTLKKWSLVTQNSILREIHELRGIVLNRFWIDNVLVVRIPVAGLKRLAENPLVVRIFDNFKVRVLDTVKSATLIGPHQTVESWGVFKIDAPGAWSMGYTGDGVRIAVLDTGVDITHPALQGKMLTIDPNDPHYPGGWMEFDENGNPVLSEPHDTYGHGTHVSGTALGGDTEDILIGVAPSAKLMHGLVLPGGSGSFAQVLAGIQWAVDPFYIDPDSGQPVPTGLPAHVISMSLGASNYYGDDLFPGIEAALMANVIVVAAIGNDGPGTSSNPGNIWGVFGVGATDQDDQPAYFSSGEVVNWPNPPSEWPFNDTYPSTYIKPDFSAPGVSITSAVPGGGYQAWDGTSMATPHVAGTVALVLQAAGWTDFSEPDTPEKVYNILKASAVDLGDPGQDTRYGWGRINAHAAVEIAQQFAKKSGVEGHVYDMVDQTPIPWATVTVAELNKTVKVTGEGYFRIPLDPGTYTLVFNAWGYQEKTITVEVKLLNGTITGYVYDMVSGLPIEGAIATLAELNLTTYTDANGTFTFSVPPGTYTLEVSAVNYQSFTTSVSVDENETVFVPIPLLPAGNGTIYGWVFDADTMQPISNATVVLDYGEAVTATDSNGYYEFTFVTPGNHTVFVFKPGYKSANATIFLAPDEAVELNFTLQKVPPSIVVLGNVKYNNQPHLATLISSLGYPVEEYLDVANLLNDWIAGNINPKVVVVDHFKSDPGEYPSLDELYAFLELSVASNATVVFLGAAYAGNTAIETLQYYHDELIQEGFPAVNNTIEHWPGADRVLVKMLNPNSSLFMNVTPDIDNMFYLADLNQSDYADYMVADFDPAVPVNVVGVINDTYNNVVGVGIAYWYSPSGAPWFYLVGWGESYWMGYLEPGADGLYSNNTAQVLLNAVWLGYNRNVSIEKLSMDPQIVKTIESLSGSMYKPALYTYVDVYLERQPYGYVEGTVVGSDGVLVSWAKITVLGTPITVSTDENGDFKTWLPAGEYTLVVTADGYAPLAVNVTVTVNETTSLGQLVLKRVPRIAVLYDYSGEIRKFIEDNFAWYAKDYDNITKMTADLATGFYDAVIHAGFYNAPMPSQEEFLAMLDVVNDLGIGIIFLDQWSSPDYPDIFGYGIRALNEYLADPAERSVGDTYDAVSLVITEEHPIFQGYEVGQVVKLVYNPGWWGTDYAFFSGFSGETIGQLYFDGQVQGDAIAWKITDTGSKWLLMASFAPEEYQDMAYWTLDALIIFANAIKWTAMKPVNVSLANPYLHVGDEAVVTISRAPSNKLFYIRFNGEVIGNVTTDINGSATFTFTVPLIPGGKYNVEAISDDELYYGMAKMYILPKLVASPTSITAPGTVNVEVTGLKAYETVMFYLDGNILSIIKASDLGVIETELNIWLVESGKHHLRLVSEDGEELFNVELTITSKLDDLGAKIDDISGMITGLQNDVAVIQTKTGEIEAKLSDLNATLVGLINSKTGELYALINTKIGNVLVKLDDLGSNIDEALSRLQELGVKVDTLSNKTSSLEQKMDTYYNNVMNKLDEILSNIQSTTQQLQEQISSNLTSVGRDVSEAKNTASTATYVGGGAIVLSLLALALAFFKKP